MKFIKIEWNDEWRGFWLDPSGYLAELHGLAEKMPAGAREFATQDGHYDFTSPRCVKDLTISRISAMPGEEYDLDVEFSPNEWKNESGLTVKYAKLRRLDISVRDPASGLQGIGALQLDEILPLDGGCSHQIAFTGGEIYIECADLHAEWTPLSHGPGPCQVPAGDPLIIPNGSWLLSPYPLLARGVRASSGVATGTGLASRR